MTTTTDTDAPIEKLLPCSIEAEMGALGSVLIDSMALTALMAHLEPNDFYREAHRTIYAGMLSLRASGQPIDLITLTDELGKLGSLDDVGGVSYVSSLANQVPTSMNADHYAKIVADKALLRRVVHFASQIAAIAYNEADVESVIETGEVLWQDATLRRSGRDSVDIGDAITSLLGAWDEAVTQDRAPGVMTGLRRLDDHLLGIQRGELVYLAGRPGSGKSALAAVIAEHVARSQGLVEWVSLEMSNTQQAKRIITAWAGVNGRIIRAGFRRPDGSIDYEAYEHANAVGADLRAALRGRLRLYDKPLTIKRLRSHAQRAVYQRGCTLLIVDYLGLIEGESDRERDYERVSKISRQLKQLALELNIPIICLVQMNREAEKRQNKRPQMADLRDSGGLEQDADCILGVYRGATADPDRAATDVYFAEFGELLVLKAREGVAGVTIPFRFQGEYTRPSDWPDEWPYEPYLQSGRGE